MKKPKALLVGDMHIHPTAAYPEFLKDIRETFGWIAGLLDQHNPSHVIFLGDVFHTGSNLHAEAMWEAASGFRMFSGDHERLRILVGNHDLHREGEVVHALAPWREYCVESANLQDEILFLPYERKPYLNTTAWASEGGFKFAVGHLPIEGGTYQSGVMERDGYRWSSDKPLFNGHYHAPGQVGNIVFCGASIARTFDDQSDIPHGVTLVYDDGTFERIPNPHSKRFVKLAVSDKKSFDALKANTGTAEANRLVVRAVCSPKWADKVKDLAGFHAVEVVMADEPSTAPVVSAATLNLSVRDILATTIPEVAKETGLNESALYELARNNTVTEAAQTRPPLEFNWLTATDFLSLGEITRFCFNNGFMLVEGSNLDDPGSKSNGSGKSSLFEAIYWTLFGSTLRGVTGDDVIRAGAKGCSTEMEFVVGEQLHRLSRYRKHPKLGTGVSLAVWSGTDWNLISPRAVKEAQIEIDRLIGIPEDMFRQLFFLTNGLESRFTALGDADRKRLIESLLRMKDFDLTAKSFNDAHAKAVKDVERARAVREMKESELNRAQEAHRNASRDSETKMARLQEERTELKAAILEDIKSITSWQNHVTLKEGEEAAAIEAERTASKALSDKSVALTQIVERRAKFQSSWGVLSQELNKKQSLLSAGNCPVCHQSMASATVLSQDASDTARQAEEAKAGYEAASREFEAMNAEMQGFSQEASQARNRASLARSEAGEARKGLMAASNAKSARELRLASNIAEGKAEAGRLEALAAEAVTRSGELDKAKAEEAKFGQDHVVLKALADMMTPTGPVRAKVIGAVIGFLNDRLREFSQALLGDRTVQLDASTVLKRGGVSDRISIHITGSRDYTSYSSGERRRVDLAIQFALNSLARASTGFDANLLVCDEIDDKLDESGMEALASVLSRMSETSAVYLVTQHGFLKSLVPAVMVVEKKNGISSLKGVDMGTQTL